MIKTTTAYKEAIKKNRIFHHKVNIKFADQTNMTVDDIDLFTFSCQMLHLIRIVSTSVQQ